MSVERLVVAGKLIDGNTTEVHKNRLLTITDSVITSIEDAASIPQGCQLPIDDFSHCTLLPALVDCSVSLLKSPSLDQTEQLTSTNTTHTKKESMLARHIADCFAHGVLAVVENDNANDLVACYQSKRPDDHKIGIQIPVTYKPNSHSKNLKKTASKEFFKLNYSADIDTKINTLSTLNHQEMRSILRDKGSTKAVVVANGQQEVKEAIEAGCDSIEQGFSMGKDNLKEMARNNILWIPNLVRAKNALDGSVTGGSVCCRFSTRYVAPGKPIPGAEEFWKKMLNEQLQQLSFAREIGVMTAIGTGAGNAGVLHGESVIEEIKLFIKAGFSLAEAIRCASSNGASFFNIDNLGPLTVGQRATFLVTRGSVKQLPRKLSYLENIYVNGVPSHHYQKNPIKVA